MYIMTLVVVGINHNFASVSGREKINPEVLSTQILAQSFRKNFKEAVLLSTCNRTELYLVASDTKIGEEKAVRLFGDLTPYVYRDQEAVRYLFRVASGMDSMVLGESEILGQLKLSYLAAIKSHTVGPILHQLFQEAL